MAMPAPTPDRIECVAALSDLVLKAARAVIPRHADLLMQLPDSGARNQPLLPLLVGLLDAAKVTALAVADNAWDSNQPIDETLATELACVAHQIQIAVDEARAHSFIS